MTRTQKWPELSAIICLLSILILSNSHYCHAQVDAPPQIVEIQQFGGTNLVAFLADDSDTYYILRTSTNIEDFVQIGQLADAKGIGFATQGTNHFLTVPVPGEAAPRFFAVEKIPSATPMDIDRDGMDDIYELRRIHFLNPMDARDAPRDQDQDGFTNREEYDLASDPEDPLSPDINPLVIHEIDPFNGEEMVSVARPAIIRFRHAMDPATLTTNTFYLLANSGLIPGRVVLSSTGLIAHFYPDNPLPPSTEIRIYIEGDQILTASGLEVDFTGDGETGGQIATYFRTLPLTRIPNTTVFGFVKDSDTQEPLANVTIRVDAFPEASVTTDATGRFELTDMPAPDFFVHIDGSTADAPAGFTYPNVGKPFHSVPGMTNQIAMAGVPFDIYLPIAKLSDYTPLSDTETTLVPFGENAKSRLAAMRPEFDPSLWDEMAVTIEGSAAVDSFGNPAAQATVIPVEPTRLPAPLPPGIEPNLVVSIQAPGATTFDQPAAITFPNAEGFAPGEIVALTSFNHDAGRWDVVGTATVSDDGRTVTTDPGVGVVAPGWHFLAGLAALFGALGNCDSDAGAEAFKEALAFGLRSAGTLATGAAVAFSVGTGGSGAIPAIVLGAGANLALNTAANMLDNDGITRENRNIAGRGFTSLSLATLNSSGAGNTFTKILGPVVGAGFFVSDVIDLKNQYDNEVKPAMDQALAAGSDCGSDDIGIGSPLANLNSAASALGPATENWNDNLQGYDNFWDGFESSTLPSSPLDPGVRSSLQAARDIMRPPVPVEPVVKQFLDAARGLHDALKEVEDQFLADDVRYKVKDESGNVIKTGTSTGRGEWSVNAQEGTNLEVCFYNPANNRSIRRSLVAGTAGSRNEIGAFGVGGVPFRPIAIEDPDGDLLDAIAEEALGTSPTNPDTDGDGINDYEEIQQGLDPLDGISAPLGILANLEVGGSCQEVAMARDAASQDLFAFLACGSAGLQIVDANEFQLPIELGQFADGFNVVDVAVDPVSRLAALACGNQGLPIVSYADPMLPEILRLGPVDATRVEVQNGIAYCAVGNEVVSIDLFSAAILQRLVPSGNSPVTDISLAANKLYAMTANHRLHVVDISGIRMIEVGAHTMNDAGGRLRVGDGLAFCVAKRDRGGFAVADVNDPTAPFTISDSDIARPNIGPKSAIVPNGSGLALRIGPASGLNLVEVVDVSTPADTDVLVRRYPMDGVTHSGAIAAGIGYIANGGAGLTVLNYMPFDVNSQPPTGILYTTASNNTVVAGSRQFVCAQVEDDVQVRQVDFFLNGEPVSSDLDFQFEFPWSVSPDAVGSQIVLTATATDTGGNSVDLNSLTYTVTPDTTAPTLSIISPMDNSGFFQGETIVIDLEALDDVGIGEVAIYLNGSLVDATRVSLFQYAISAPGSFDNHTITARVTDLSGNTSDMSSISFRIRKRAISREVSFYNDGAPKPRAISREVSFHNDGAPKPRAISREVSFHNDGDPPRRTISREVSIENEP